MGCWYSTCAFSRLVIHHGEPIRFLPIVQNHWKIEALTGHADSPPPVLLNGGSECYATGWWTPFCFPIRGRYNDYGSIEEIPQKTKRDKAELAAFVETIKRHVVPLKLGENSCHDISVDKDIKLDKILDAFHEGRLYARYSTHRGNHVTVPLAAIMIKEEVWQAMLELDLKGADSFYEPPTVASLRTKLKGQIVASDAWDRFYGSAKDDPQKEALFKVAKELTHGGKTNPFSGRQSIAFDHGSARSPLELEQCSYDRKQLLNVAAELDLVIYKAGILRLAIHPTVGAGSQADNLKLWANLSRRWIKDDLARQRRLEREWD